MKIDYNNRGWRIFIISLFTGLLSLIIWLISPPLPEGREYIFIQVPVMSGIIVTLFWLGQHEFEELKLNSGIIYIFGALILLAMMVVTNLKPTQFKQEQSYISTYQVHYLDGSIDTAFVTGERSQEASVDPPGFFGGGYSFCGEEGIYRVRLLSVKKDLKPTTTSRNSIKLKNNK